MPDEINVRFLKNFRNFILQHLREGRRFFIVAGGGKLARRYQEAASKVINISNEDLDWLGIHSTRINAHLLRTIFYRWAYPVVLDNPSKPFKNNYKIVIASGSTPGWSTDYIAFRIAERFKVKGVIIAGSPAYVYDKDHRRYRTAKPLKEISWKEYVRIIKKRWRPGLSLPVDPVAAKFAREKRMKAVILRGTDLNNLNKVLEGRQFKGTIIKL